MRVGVCVFKGINKHNMYDNTCENPTNVNSEGQNKYSKTCSTAKRYWNKEGLVWVLDPRTATFEFGIFSRSPASRGLGNKDAIPLMMMKVAQATRKFLSPSITA